MVASADVAGYVALGRRTAAKMITEHFDLAKNPACSCHTCRPISLSDPEGMFMRLCPECGNKRCPKATNHIHACTDSNDSGQEGSIY
jgi:hypothetical protein